LFNPFFEKRIHFIPETNYAYPALEAAFYFSLEMNKQERIRCPGGDSDINVAVIT